MAARRKTTGTYRRRGAYRAAQWFPERPVAGVKLTTVNGQETPQWCFWRGAEGYSIAPGDWVVTDPSGFRHVVERDLFAFMYEEG